MASSLCVRGRTVHGLFWTVADLAETMREILNDEFCAYYNKNLKKHLKRIPHELKYYTKNDHVNGVVHIGISSRQESFSLQPSKLYGKPKFE